MVWQHAIIRINSTLHMRSATVSQGTFVDSVCIKAAHYVVCKRGQSRRRTQYEVIVFAVGLRAGAGLRTVGSLAWRGERGKLRWADGTGAQHSRPVQAFAVLRGSTGALGRSGGFRVLLGEEDRGAPADLRGQRRRRRAQIYGDKRQAGILVHLKRTKPLEGDWFHMGNNVTAHGVVCVGQLLGV